MKPRNQFGNSVAATGVGLLLTMACNMALAQGDDELMMRRGASTDEIMGKLRSIRRPTASETGGAVTGRSQAPTALAVRIYFNYDSAELSPEAKAELDNYGKALTAGEFTAARWNIEGHTDASGSAGYNLNLSERRARSVYDYLVREYGMSPDRLIPLGKGESELYDPANPNSGLNRRVRIKYLGG